MSKDRGWATVYLAFVWMCGERGRRRERERLIIGIGLYNYGGREDPWSATYKLENQPVVWFSLSSEIWKPRELMVQVSVWIQRVQDSGDRGYWDKSWSKSEGPGARIASVWGQGQKGCLSSSKESKFILPPSFALLRPPTNWIRPICTGENDLLYSVYQLQMLTSFQKHPHRHAQ